MLILEGNVPLSFTLILMLLINIGEPALRVCAKMICRQPGVNVMLATLSNNSHIIWLV